MDAPCHRNNDRLKRRYDEHDWELECVEAKNGERMIRVVCSQCCVHSEWIGHAALLRHGVDPLTLPIDRSLRGDESCCVRDCSRSDTELHHFAPRSVFGIAADDWPVMPLCRDHHRYWHQLMGNYKLTTTGAMS